MNTKDEEFLKRLLATFKVEAEEHINVLSTGLIELEQTPDKERRIEITETIFREAHSLKGAARAVNLVDIESVCQAMESVFSSVKREDIDLSPELFDLLHQANDSLIRLLSVAKENLTYADKTGLIQLVESLRKAAEGLVDNDPKINRETKKTADDSLMMEVQLIRHKPDDVNLKQNELTGDNDGGFASQPVEKAAPELKLQKHDLSETIRVSTSRLIPLLLQAEELLLAKLAVGEQINELAEIRLELDTWRGEWAKVNREIHKVQHQSNEEAAQYKSGNGKELNTSVEFLEWNHVFMRSLEDKLAAVSKSVQHNYHSFGNTVDTLLQDTKKVLMLPLSSILEGFPKMARDLSRDQKKEVDLVIHGGDVEIDRRILEEIKDPLIHLVRNCIDHGIEKPEERKRKKKPVKGLVTIAVGQKNSHAEIVISDDGAGIDVNKIKKAALRMNILSSEQMEHITDSEAQSLIFQSGVSTSPIITDISGRGLGLAIVYEKVVGIGGEISFETSTDTGTMFRIILPLTMATFRGVIVRASERLFVLPTTSVEQVCRINKQLIKTVGNKTTIELDNKAVSLVDLTDVLEISRDVPDKNTDILPVVVLAYAESRIAFLVDDILNEQEVLVKTLGRQLSRVRNIAGAAILGTGKVVLILNVRDLLKSAVNMGEVASISTSLSTQIVKKVVRSILVVEDSITSRTLLKSILETAGYNVTTAVDGVDAYTKLKAGNFNIVISDVDMPRLNGFGLTAKIRGDKKYADLPVVLVTALDSNEDRERGIDAGADAYIVKSNFDQSNLLEVVERLV